VAAPPLAPLHELYYLHNFLALCKSVEAQYADILNDEERMFLLRFYTLDQRAQCLYVRMVSRAGPWFRMAKLNYPEIGELTEAIDELVELQFVVEPEGLSVEEIGRLLTKAELQSVYGEKLSGALRLGKAELLAEIEILRLDEEQHLGLVSSFLNDRIRAPIDVEHLDLLQLLFFGNRHQNLTDFVLSDLGVANYYPYALNRRHRLFTCREALEEYLYCCELQDTFYQFVELDDNGLVDVASLMLEVDCHFEVSTQRWQKVWNTTARELERRGQLELATHLYLRSGRHPARERRARILESLGDWPAVISICEEILASPWGEAEREAALTIVARARRKCGGKVVRRQADNFEQIKLTLEQSCDCVELDTAQYFERQWSSVHYVENGLMNTLFGLAFWEQIFEDVPGAFHNAYQGVPRDMYDTGFTALRAKSIEARLIVLKDKGLKKELIKAYRRFCPYTCHWTDWRLVDEGLLVAALDIIPESHLYAIWERILYDPAENRSGFPDLIALGETLGDYQMIEVKGPGDALQNNQKRWLRYFAIHSIPASVAWVEWAGV